MVSAQIMEKVFTLELEHSYGSIIKKSIAINYGYIPDKTIIPETGYRLEIFDINDEFIYEYVFTFETQASVSRDISCYNEDGSYNQERCADQSTVINSDQDTQIIELPYSNIAKKIDIYDTEGKLVYTLDLSEFIDYCGDNTCSKTESKWTCSIDCEKDFVDDKNKKRVDLYLIILLVFVLIIGIIIFYLVKKR